MMRTAPRARCSAGPARHSLVPVPSPVSDWPSSLSRRSGVLFRIVFPPHPPFFHFPCFLCLALGVGVAASHWLSDSWAGCPLTVPSPEQKSRRGSPSVCLASCFLVPGGLWPASIREARADAVFKDCCALQLAARRGMELSWERLPWPVATLAVSPAGLTLPPVVFREG